MLLELAVECGGELIEAVVEIGVCCSQVVTEHARPCTDVDNDARTARSARCHHEAETDRMPERVGSWVDEIELLAFERRH